MNLKKIFITAGLAFLFYVVVVNFIPSLIPTLRKSIANDYVTKGVTWVDGASVNEKSIDYSNGKSAVQNTTTEGESKSHPVANAAQLDKIAQDGWNSSKTVSENPSGMLVVYMGFMKGNISNMVRTYSLTGERRDYIFPEQALPQEESTKTCTWLTNENFFCQVKIGGSGNENLRRYNYLIHTTDGSMQLIKKEEPYDFTNYYAVSLDAPYVLQDAPNGKTTSLLNKSDFSVYKTIAVPDGVRTWDNKQQNCFFRDQQTIWCYMAATTEMYGNYTYDLASGTWTQRKDLNTRQIAFNPSFPYQLSSQCLYGWSEPLDMSGYYECERMAFYLEKEGKQPTKVLEINRKSKQHFPTWDMIGVLDEKFYIRLENKDTRRTDGYYRVDPTKY
jgi:hypothetical protein